MTYSPFNICSRGDSPLSCNITVAIRHSSKVFCRFKLLILLMFIQSNAITKPANLAIDIVTRSPVIDPVAVADVEAELGAVPPDGVLHEPRKKGRERRIESPGVDLLGHQGNNVGAAAWPVAASTIEMVGAEPGQARCGAENCEPVCRWRSWWRRPAARSRNPAGPPAEGKTRS